MKEAVLSKVDLQDGRGPRDLIGVAFDPPSRQWTAHVVIDGRRVYAGHHPDPVSAAKAHDSLVRTYLQQPVRLNFPEQTEASE